MTDDGWRPGAPGFPERRDEMRETTCFIERSKVRDILINSDVIDNDSTDVLLVEVDALPIFTAADLGINAARAPLPSPDGCPTCMGSGYSNHPDSGEICQNCGGQGVVDCTPAASQEVSGPVDITGWKLVPDQPTEEMWQAGRSADIHPGDSYSKVWSAMFEAAPNVDDCETIGVLRTFDRSAVIEECAKVCDELRHEDYSCETAEWSGGTFDCARAIRSLSAETRPAPEPPAATPPTGCIICANGNDLPDGEHCRACGREGSAIGLRAAVIKARGRQEPPTAPVKFAAGLPSPDVIDGIAKTIWLSEFGRAFSRVPSDPWENQAEPIKEGHRNSARKIIEAGYCAAPAPLATAREALEQTERFMDADMDEAAPATGMREPTPAEERLVQKALLDSGTPVQLFDKSDETPVAWITKAGLENWLKGDCPENHVLLRTGNDMREPLYMRSRSNQGSNL